MAGDDMRARANADYRYVGDIYLVAVGHVDLDADIVAGVPAGADPDGHRQPRRTRKQVRHLKEFFSVGLGDLLHALTFERRY